MGAPASGQFWDEFRTRIGIPPTEKMKANKGNLSQIKPLKFSALFGLPAGRPAAIQRGSRGNSNRGRSLPRRLQVRETLDNLHIQQVVVLKFGNYRK
jgi:hypothetical protein